MIIQLNKEQTLETKGERENGNKQIYGTKKKG